MDDLLSFINGEGTQASPSLFFSLSEFAFFIIFCVVGISAAY